MTVDLLTEAPLAPPAGLGPYRRWDYESLPDQPRCELLFGRLYVMPSPSLPHQAVLQAMWLHFNRIAQASGGRAFLAPMDVTLADHSVVQPDVIFVSPERFSVLRERIEGAPDLLVEVLSRGTARRDRGEKLILYAQTGIREYWIVDPRVCQIEFLVNEEGRFVVAVPLAGRYQSQNLPEIQLDIAEFWRQAERQLPPAVSPAPSP